MQSIIILFAVFAATAGNATVFSTLGLLGRGIGLSELEVGAIFASSALLFFLTSSHWGRLSDRIGRAPVIAAGLAATAASLFGFAVLYTGSWRDTFIGFLLARMIYGAVAGGIQPAATAYMAQTTTAEKRAGVVALVGASVGIGSIVGPVTAAALVGLGLAIPVAATGAMVAFAGIVTFFAVRERPPAVVAGSDAASSARGLTPCLLLAFAMVLGFGALQPTMAFYVQDRFRLETAMAIRDASFSSTAFAVCSFVVQAVVIRTLPLRPRAMLKIGLAMCLAAIAGTLLASAPRALIVAFGLLGAGYGLAQSGLTAMVSFIGGQRQGHVAGRLHAAMSAAWIVGALGGTALYSVSVYAPLLLAAAAMALALLIRAPRSADESGPGHR